MTPEIALLIRASVLFAIVLLIERGLRRRASRRRAELPDEFAYFQALKAERSPKHEAAVIPHFYRQAA